MRVVFAGGGTGGHLTPALALAAAAAAAGWQPLFVTGDRPIEDRVLAGMPWARRALKVQGWTGGLAQRLQTIGLWFHAWLEMRGTFREAAPALVVATGGYVAVPTVLAARRTPLVVVEPNAVVGRATRLLARRARVVVTVVPEASVWPRATQRIVGIPVRPEVIVPLEARRVTDAPPRILVFGGSQGAESLNREVPAAIAAAVPGARVEHVSGPGRVEAVRDRYAKVGIDAEVVPYADDMPERLRRADLAITRAGAATVAELAAARLPAILVPYPHAADDHQRANAALLAERGAAALVDEREPEFAVRLQDALATWAAPIQRRQALTAYAELPWEVDPERLWRAIEEALA